MNKIWPLFLLFTFYLLLSKPALAWHPPNITMEPVTAGAHLPASLGPGGWWGNIEIKITVHDPDLNDAGIDNPAGGPVGGRICYVSYHWGNGGAEQLLLGNRCPAGPPPREPCANTTVFY